MKRQYFWSLALMPVILVASDLLVTAQTQRALDRRLDRNERQLQRQANRATYFGEQTWQQLDPWIQNYGISPVRRAANAVEGVADAVGDAAARTRASFGFQNANPQDPWFYDYYTYRPTYYYSPVDGERYLGAIRYFDADNDGVFESNAYYRDSDEDGYYDEYSQYYFSEPERVEARTTTTVESTDDAYQLSSDTRRHRLEGKIAMAKTAQVNGQEHLVVALESNQQSSLAIDLGPAEAMRGKQVEVGSQISVVGAVETIGEKQILIAETATINGQTVQIDRQVGGTTLQGVVVDVRQTEIGSTPHYMAIIEANGQRQLVDLGATTTYKFQFKPQTQIAIRGVPVQTHGYQVIMADRVRVGDETIQVNRSESFSF